MKKTTNTESAAEYTAIVNSAKKSGKIVIEFARGIGYIVATADIISRDMIETVTLYAY